MQMIWIQNQIQLKRNRTFWETLPIPYYVRFHGTPFINFSLLRYWSHCMELVTFLSLPHFSTPEKKKKLFSGWRSVAKSTDWKCIHLNEVATVAGFGFSVTNSIPCEWKNSICIWMNVHGSSLFSLEHYEMFVNSVQTLIWAQRKVTRKCFVASRRWNRIVFGWLFWYINLLHRM